MPEKDVIDRARRDAREGKSPSTQAGEFVHEEIRHIREGKHGAQSAKQAIAIGLSKARRAGVKLPPPPAGSTSKKPGGGPSATSPEARPEFAPALPEARTGKRARPQAQGAVGRLGATRQPALRRQRARTSRGSAQSRAHPRAEGVDSHGAFHVEWPLDLRPGVDPRRTAFRDRDIGARRTSGCSHRKDRAPIRYKKFCSKEEVEVPATRSSAASRSRRASSMVEGEELQRCRRSSARGSARSSCSSSSISPRSAPCSSSAPTI